MDRKLDNTDRLLEKVLSRDNLNKAYRRVKSNSGSHGVDRLMVDELLPHLKSHGENLKKSILEGKYTPQAVRRVEIPKADGGVRLLGIPTVVDRLIQQAISQVLSPIFDKEFSEYSYGFRPNRSAHDAIKQAREYMESGYKIVVDIDLEKFFDRVNHDKLMYLLSKRIADKRLLGLIRKYLESGIMVGGIVRASTEGTPQGGPLSPLLSNVMLNELDQELTKRGHRYCRYADDCNIYVKSLKAGHRVMQSIGKFIVERLHLKVNESKSAVDKPSQRKFLGMTFYRNSKGVGVAVHPKSIARIKAKVKTLTQRSNGINIKTRIERISNLIRGWVNYFSISDMLKHCRLLDEWMRRRLRMCIWKQWKKIKTRGLNLKRFGMEESLAWQWACTRKGHWRTAKSPILNTTITNQYLRNLGLIEFTSCYRESEYFMNRRTPNGTYGGVRGQLAN